jgi:hypothetical protein
MARVRRLLFVLAAAGGPVFTLAWLVLGWLAPSHEQRADTISTLAAEGAPEAAAMVAGFTVLGIGQLALAALASRRLAALSAALVVAGMGTALAGAVQVPDDGTAAPVHTLAATAAFTGLHLAVLAGALSRSMPLGLRVGAVVALVVAVPHTVWFAVQLSDPGPWFGYAEKTFTTVLLAWTTALAFAHFPGREVLDQLRVPGPGLP